MWFSLVYGKEADTTQWRELLAGGVGEGGRLCSESTEPPAAAIDPQSSHGGGARHCGPAGAGQTSHPLVLGE